jgi:hypothetical protein
MSQHHQERGLSKLGLDLNHELRGSRPCVVRKWRFGRPVPSVETTFTRPIPVGDGTTDWTKWRVDTSLLSLRHTNQAVWTAVWFVFTTHGPDARQPVEYWFKTGLGKPAIRKYANDPNTQKYPRILSPPGAKRWDIFRALL